MILQKPLLRHLPMTTASDQIAASYNDRRERIITNSNYWCPSKKKNDNSDNFPDIRESTKLTQSRIFHHNCSDSEIEDADFGVDNHSEYFPSNDECYTSDMSWTHSEDIDIVLRDNETATEVVDLRQSGTTAAAAAEVMDLGSGEGRAEFKVVEVNHGLGVKTIESPMEIGDLGWDIPN